MRRAALRHASLIFLLLVSCRLVVKPDYLLDRFDYVGQDRSEHFDIYLEKEYGERFRRDLREWLEEIYDKVGGLFHEYPERRTVVKIYSSSLRTPTGLEYFGYAGERAIYSKRFHGTRRNLAHEYTHFIAARMAGVRLPGWFNEGLATYVSNHVNGDIHPTLEEEIFAFVHGDFLHLHSTAGLMRITSLPRRSMKETYSYGSSFISYLSEVHGFGGIVEALGRVKESGGVEEALAAVLGVPFEDLEEAWRLYLQHHAESARYEKYGLIRDWHVIGPFDNFDGRGCARPFPPEGEGGTDLEAEFPSMGRVVRWRRFRSNHPVGFIDLRQCEFSPSKYAVAYATTTIYSPKTREVEILAGADDTLTLWLNGERLIHRDAPRPFRTDSDRTSATLLRGNNIILLKVCQFTFDWRFAVRILDGGGDPIPDLLYMAE